MQKESNAMEFPERFRRHIHLADFTPELQTKLALIRVLVAGAGGLGGLVTAELTAVGVGHLTICDDGELEESNLNRQIFYRDNEMGRTKAQVLAERMSEFAPKAVFRSVQERIDEQNVDTLISGFDLIMDCFDNDESRFILNRAAVKASIPIIHGGIRGWNGEAAILNTRDAPCFACLRPAQTPAASDPIPVIATAAAFIAVLQANLAVRFLIGSREQVGSLFLWNGRAMELDRITIRKNSSCDVCGA